MKKILIVDDEEMVRFMLCECLKDEGYEVIEGENGYDGLNLARMEQPDLVIMDINMPQMDGIEAVRNLRADSEISHIPIFISTGVGNAKKNFTKEQMTEVQGFVEKPYQIEKILGQIKNILKE